MKVGYIVVAKNDGSVPGRFNVIKPGTFWKVTEDRGNGKITVMDRGHNRIRTYAKYFKTIDEQTFDSLTNNGGETDMYFRLAAIDNVGPDTDFPPMVGITEITVNSDTVQVATSLVSELGAHKSDKLVQRKLNALGTSRSGSCC